jgi:serine/threonine-protein kinase
MEVLVSALPNLTPEDVGSVLEEASNIQEIGRGGQKIVFRADIGDDTYAVKFILLPDDFDPEEQELDEVAARARREVETMRQCESDHLVKLGPVELQLVELKGQKVFFFSEEFIEGADLASTLATEGPLSTEETIRLGLNVNEAVVALWRFQKVHRDIKPKNIMRRQDNGDFVLLDTGLVFDVLGDSLSGGFLFGTFKYFSPEQFDYTSRRTILDHRSDMFSLGVTMYEMVTGQHPFCEKGDAQSRIFSKILQYHPPAPSEIRPEIPESLDSVILRMMGKAPHLRYRTNALLKKALEAIEVQK